MTPQLRNELLRDKQAIDQEIMTMRGGRENGGGGGPSWARRRAAQAELPEATGWSVPVEIETRDRDGYGKVTIYLSFPPETFSDAAEIIEALQAEGIPVKVWRQKQYEDRSGGGRGYGGNGYGRGGYGDRDGGDRGGWRR